MPSPTKAELLAEISTLRSRIEELENRLDASHTAMTTASTLAQSGTELNESLDADQIAQRIVSTLLRLFGVRHAILFQRDPASDTLKCIAAAGEGNPGVCLGKSFPAGSGIAGRAVAEGRAVRSSDLVADPRSILLPFPGERFLEDDTFSAASAPLAAGGAAVGAVVLTDVAGRTFSQDELQTLTTFAQQAALALENARLHGATLQRVQQLTILMELTQTLTTVLDPKRVAQEILAAILTMFPDGVAELYERSADGESLRLIDIVGVRGGRENLRREFRVGEGLVGLVAATRQPVWSPDVTRDSRLLNRAWATAEGVVSSIMLPLIHRDRLEGVLVVLSRVSHDFTQEEVRLLRSFATHAAIALENASLHSATVRRGAELEALLRATHSVMSGLDLQGILDRIVTEAAQISGCPHVKVLLVDKAAGVLQVGALKGTAMSHGDRLPLGTGHSGIVAVTGQHVFSDDCPNDHRNAYRERDRELGIVTYLGLPIKSRDEVIGVLTFNTTGPRQYAPDEVAYLTSFAAQAAIAIENARLFQEEQERGSQLEAVRAVSADITRELDLRALLELIMQRAQGLMQAGTGTIHLWDEENRVLVPQAWSGFGEWRGSVRLRLGDGVAGTVALRREGLVVNDFRTSPYALPIFLERTTYTAVLAEPLLYRGRLVGVIGVTREQTGPPFTEHDRKALALFAAQAAVAIENARLYAELNESYRNLQKAQEELIRSEKLRALGHLAAGIAHDLNNVLAAILGQVELLRLRVDDPDLQARLGTLQTAATDGAQIVRRLQGFTRQQPTGPLVACDLASLVRETVDITRPRWRDEAQRRGVVIEVRTSLEGLRPILGQPAEIREALTNLILNAVDAMPDGGTLTLTGRADDGGVTLAVRDTGKGMTDDVRRRIFEPFFTTKGGQGTGLGLSVVYGILQRHGGHIDVASTPGKGTSFTLRFRVAAAPLAPETEPPTRPSKSRRILVIDDDATVRETVASLLRTAGHTVIEANDGPTGLATLSESPVDLVLTDLGMPEMTGWDVARAVKARSPHLPVVLLTGWGDQLGADAAEFASGRLVDRVLSKPFRLQDLLAVISELTADSP